MAEGSDTQTEPDPGEGLAALRAENHALREQLAASQLELRRSTVRYRAVLDSAPMPVLLLDPGGSITDANSAAARQFGRDREALYGEALERVLPDVQPEQVRKLVAAAGSGEPQRGVERELWPAQEPDPGESLGLFPLRDSEGRIVSLLWCEDLEDARETRRLLLRVNDELRRLAVVDDATGIANRRAFDRAIDGEVRRAARAETSLAVAMVDVDYFKMFNDSLGHQAGDRCLLRVARALVGAVQRAGELVARYGGEEFVALLPGVGPEDAARTGEKLRRSVQRLRLRHPGAEPLGLVTVSVGVATTKPGIRFRDRHLVEAADRALYAAKSRGRNRVVAVHLERGSVQELT